MKLTKEYIKQVIKEELNEIGEHPYAHMHDEDRVAGLEGEDEYYRKHGRYPGEPSKKPNVKKPVTQPKPVPELAKKLWGLAMPMNQKNPGSGADFMVLGNLISTGSQSDKLYIQPKIEQLKAHLAQGGFSQEEIKQIMSAVS